MDDGYPQQAAPKGGTSPWAGTPLEDLPPLLPPDPDEDAEPHGSPVASPAGGLGSQPAPGNEASGLAESLAGGRPEGRPPPAQPPQNWPTERIPAENSPTESYPAESYPAQGHPAQGFGAEGQPAGYPAGGYPTEEYLSDADDEDLGLIEASVGPPPRVRLLTAALVLGILAALGFSAGVVVQRRHDSTLVSAQGGAGALANRAGRGAGTGGGGFGGGGFGGAGQGNSARTGAGGVTGADAGGAGGAAGGAAGGDTAAATPIVVGTVTAVTPRTLMVRNFADAVVTVHVPAGTPVTTQGMAGLKPGMTVAVTGTRAADGSVTATSVVSRG